MTRFTIVELLNMTPMAYAKAVNEDRKGEGFLLPEDPAYFAEEGWESAYEYVKSLTLSTYSDVYKDLNGFRPTLTARIASMDLNELEQEIDRICMQMDDYNHHIDEAAGGDSDGPLTYNPFKDALGGV